MTDDEPINVRVTETQQEDPPPPEVAEDPGPPYLLFDLYPFDLGPLPAFDAAAAFDADDDGDADIRGGILKATDGVAYGYTSWFVENFKRMIETAGDNRGKSTFLGAYHYTQFFEDGVQQAEFYLRILEAAGWTPGVDIVPIVDVEFGGERAANHRATTPQIIDVVSAFAERCIQITGRGCMLYGRGTMRDRSIESRMGCDRVWNPAYTATMVTNGLCGTLPNGRAAPWSVDDVVLWQYGGDGTGDTRVHKLPIEVRGFGHGKVDISVYVDGARPPTLETMRKRLL